MQNGSKTEAYGTTKGRIQSLTRADPETREGGEIAIYEVISYLRQYTTSKRDAIYLSCSFRNHRKQGSYIHQSGAKTKTHYKLSLLSWYARHINLLSFLN